MYLSPYTQYSLRRLLQASSMEPNPASPSLRIDANIDLNHLLCKLYPRKFVAISKANQLERLVKLYQQLTPHSPSDQVIQTELRHRIFHLLGLHLDDTAVNLPPLLQEEKAQGFRFFYADQIREGIYVDGKLYGMLVTTENFDRLSLYQIAWVLSEQGMGCVLTYSKARQALWVPVRSPVYHVYVQQGSYPLEKVLELYRLLRRFDRTDPSPTIEAVQSAEPRPQPVSAER